MTTFPGAPLLQKGSLIAIDQVTGLGVVIPFQYNPDTLTRRLTAQTASGSGDRREAFRLKGPPEETITLEVEIDATDQLESGNGTAITMGIHPKLAALELLVYPKSSHMVANDKLARQGAIEVIPPEAPLTLLVWGRMRSLPVRLTSFSITEEAFDPKLNPIRAKVSLELTVLNYMALGVPSEGGKIFLAYHRKKEQLARQNAHR